MTGLEDLESRLEELTSDLRETSAAALLDDQIRVDGLVWAHAYVQAARATRAWADRTPGALRSSIAVAAFDDARAYVLGDDLAARAAAADRLTEIGRAGGIEPGAGDDDSQRMLRATVRGFAEREVRPIAQAIHREDRDVPEAVIAGVAGLGLFGVSIPEAYGGSQQSAPDTTAMFIATEELSRASLGTAGSLMTRPEILVRALLRGGTEEQRRRWLPRIADGSLLVAVAVTEPDHGSDVASLRCRAIPMPDGAWAIDGTKMWCTFAGRAELLMVVCRTADAGHRGLSVFVLEKPAFPGRTFEHVQPGGGTLRGRAIPTIGYRGMHTFELAFERYVVPSDALVGGEAGRDRGFYLTMDGFALGRLQTAARAVGLMQAATDAAMAYAGQRLIFGRAERDLRLVQAKLGAMVVHTVAARQLGYAAARLVDGGGGQVEISLAKLYASRMAEHVAREAMQLHGAMGYGEESEISRLFVDARVLAIFEGAEEVLSQRVIGRALLGL